MTLPKEVVKERGVVLLTFSTFINKAKGKYQVQHPLPPCLHSLQYSSGF